MAIPTIYVALPAFNEELNIRPLINNLEATFELLSLQGFKRLYVIVNDGSKDGTLQVLHELADRLPMKIVNHEQNQGLGPTINDALRNAAAISNANDLIVTMDADNTHPPALIIQMVYRILEGNDIVIASRYRYGSQIIGLSMWRRLMSLGARILFQIAFPISGVRDYTCGFRIYRSKIIKQAFAVYGDKFIEHRGFQCMADILLRLQKLHPIITECPMVLRYDQKQGTSSMKVGATVIKTIKLLLQRRYEQFFQRF